jgi:hypothetical protein
MPPYTIATDVAAFRASSPASWALWTALFDNSHDHVPPAKEPAPQDWWGRSASSDPFLPPLTQGRADVGAFLAANRWRRLSPDERSARLRFRATCDARALHALLPHALPPPLLPALLPPWAAPSLVFLVRLLGPLLCRLAQALSFAFAPVRIAS